MRASTSIWRIAARLFGITDEQAAASHTRNVSTEMKQTHLAQQVCRGRVARTVSEAAQRLPRTVQPLLLLAVYPCLEIQIQWDACQGAMNNSL